MALTDESRARVAAIVLAAGMSKRMGSPKALLPLGDKTMLQSVVETLKRSGVIAQIVVVTGHEAARVAESLGGHDVVITHNHGYADGEMLSSIKTGLSALNSVDAALLALCDQPLVRVQTIRRLVEVWREKRPRVLQPRFEGMRGHPVILSAIGFKQILILSPDATLKAYTSAYPADTIELDVNDPAVTRDIDTPADYAAEQERRSACGN